MQQAFQHSNPNSRQKVEFPPRFRQRITHGIAVIAGRERCEDGGEVTGRRWHEVILIDGCGPHFVTNAWVLTGCVWWLFFYIPDKDNFAFAGRVLKTVAIHLADAFQDCQRTVRLMGTGVPCGYSEDARSPLALAFIA